MRSLAWRWSRRTARALFDAVLPESTWFVTPVPRSRAIHLTFDDGPHPEHTPNVLDVLEELGAQATFFVVGARAAAEPMLTRRIGAGGHGLGSHTYLHRDPSELGILDVVSELESTDRVMRRLFGSSPRLFRPPHGKLTPGVVLGALATRKVVTLWNRDPRDYRARTTEEVRWALARRPLTPGDVVLLHDVHRHAAAVTRTLVLEARARGLSCERLPGSLTTGSRVDSLTA